MEEYEKLYRLGSGGQGKILRVRHKATDVQYACKMILARDNYEMNFALREIKMLMDLQHEHITNYKDFFIHRDRYEDLYVCMVMELCEHGDLSTQIKEAKRKHTKFDERRIVKWMSQLCRALQYIHGRDLLHRDLKPTNVFFTAQDDVKIGDFGLSTAISTAGRRTVVGTPYYFAPELMLQQKYDSKVDMWGLGIVLMELCTLRERPINSQILENPGVVDEVTREILHNGYGPALAALTHDLLEKQPEARPTAPEVLARLANPAAAPSAGVLSQATVTLCDMCQEQPAVVQCSACDDEVFCSACDAQQHRAAKRATHVRSPLHREATAEECDRCLDGIAVVACAACDGDRLCARCDAITHKNPKRAHHVRQPLQKAPVVPTAPSGAAGPRARPVAEKPRALTRSHSWGGSPHAGRAAPGAAAQTARGLPAVGAARNIASARGTGGALATPLGVATASNRLLGDVVAKPPGTDTIACAPCGADKENIPVSVPNPRNRCAAAAYASLREPPHAPVRSRAASWVAETKTEGLERASATIRVPEEHATIALALRAAEAGDRIVVSSGTYRDHLVIDKAVVIVGEPGVVVEVDGRTAVTVTAPSGRMEHVAVRQLRSAAGTEPGLDGKFVGVNIRAVLGALLLPTTGTFQLLHCDVQSHSGACIAIHGADADPVVRNCAIHDGKQAGVYVFDGGRGRLQGNDIYNNEYAGVLLKRGGNPTLTRNKIRDGRETGVFVCHESTGVLEENEICRNQGSGIVIKGRGCPTIARNEIHSNAQAGIFCCDRGGGDIASNRIYGNSKAGVLIKTAGNPSLRNNWIHQGKETGVYVFDGGEGVLEDNDIYENQNAGVLVTTEGKPRLLRNRIQQNKYEGVWICKRGQCYLEGNDLRDNLKGAMDIHDDCKPHVVLIDNLLQ